MRPSIPHVTRLDDDSAEQLTLKAELPSLVVRRERVLIEERNAVTEVRLEAKRRPRRSQDPVGERIGQGRGDVSTVGSRNKVCRNAVTGLNDVAAALAKESEEDSISAADYRLFIQLIGKPETRHDAILGRL